MDLALALARTGAETGEVPVGAVVVDAAGSVLGQAHNLVETLNDPTAHAEILALRQAAARIGSPRLTECDLYVTLEPCPMCAHAMSLARVRRLYFGADDPKGGGVENGPRVLDATSCHHRPEIYGGIADQPAVELLREFFKARR